jgi:hypothetical protein
MSSVVQMRLRAQSTGIQICELHRQEGALHCSESSGLAAEHHRLCVTGWYSMVGGGID